MQNWRRKSDGGGVGVIPRYLDNHPHHSSSFGMNPLNSSDTNGKVAFSPVSPLSPLESAHHNGWSSSQSSGSPPQYRAPTTGHGHHHQSDEITSHLNVEDRNVQLALREIENRLLLDDDEEEGGGDGFNSGGGGMMFSQLVLVEEGGQSKSSHESIGQQQQQQQGGIKELIERMSDPRQLLLLCAESISNNNFSLADLVIARLNQVVSIYGAPIHRLAAYMVEGLVARIQSSGTGLCRALRCKEPVGNEVLSAMQIMYEVCPYIKFGYMAANGAIAEALKDEPRVHIIDFEIAQGTQYISLIQALALRPGGPPTVRITGVGDPTADVAAPGGVQVVGQRLSRVAQSVGVPFEFHAVPVNAAGVTRGMVELRDGEAVAVNFAMQLHHMADESVSVANPRDRLLRLARSLGPKIVTLVEQEANTNTAPFMARFKESLSYYSAVFESLDVTLPRESKERVSVEQHCLAKDLVNLIACEGAERVERHEVMGKWRARMGMAGFRQCPLSGYVNQTISCLLRTYCDKYRLSEDNGVIYLGWLDRSLVAASAWN